MKLMIDMGNSSLKWAILKRGQLGSQQCIPYQNNRLEDLLTATWSQLNVPFQSIWVSNVTGPQKAEVLAQWVKKHWKLQPTLVKTSYSEYGIKNGYENPHQLGVDRWLALIGAYHLETGMLCVIDCGTAVTLDVLSAPGHHLGGLIMPGITTMQHALSVNTYALESLNQTEYQRDDCPLLAHDTHTGIALGTLYAVIGWLEYVMNTLERQGNKPMILLTGGGASAFKSFLNRPYRHVPDLVLQGLVIVANKSS